MNIAVVVVTALLGATGPAAVDEVGGGDPIFTRVEPHLAAGARALQAEDADLALERFRRAQASTDEERGVVEYNAGQALLLQAIQKAQAAADATAAPAAGQPPTTPPTAPTPPDITDALAAFERAAALGRAPPFVSEARLAAGNAALVGSKLDDAIAQFRKALVAEPRNERARRNLQRALELKQQQPEQEPQDGDGKGNDDEKKDGEKKEGDQDKKDGEQQGNKDDAGEQDKPADQKNDGDTPEEKQGEEPKPDDKPGEQDDQQAEQKPGDDKDGKDKGDKGKADGGEPKPAPAPKKPTSKEEARRLLEGIRSRERPLSPIEMRGTERRPAENGKDW